MLTVSAPTLYLGYNPNLAEIFWDDLWDGLWDNFIQNSVRNFLDFLSQFFGTVKSPKVKYRKIKFPHTVLKILSAQISWKNFFFKKFFFNDLELFSGLQNHSLGCYFFQSITEAANVTRFYLTPTFVSPDKVYIPNRSFVYEMSPSFNELSPTINVRRNFRRSQLMFHKKEEQSKNTLRLNTFKQ